MKKGQQTPCGKEIANYTKLSNVTLTKGIAVMASTELSFIEESRGGDSRGRKGRFPTLASTESLVTKNSPTLKGKEEIFTLDTMQLKEGLWRQGCSHTAYLIAFVNAGHTYTGVSGPYSFLYDKFAVN